MRTPIISGLHPMVYSSYHSRVPVQVFSLLLPYHNSVVQYLQTKLYWNSTGRLWVMVAANDYSAALYLSAFDMIADL